MNVRVRTSRSTDAATMWLWDWFGSASMAVVAGVALVALRDALPWWTVIAVAPGCMLTRRIQIQRQSPAVGSVTLFWFIVPLRTQRFDVRALISTHGDDWSGPDDAPRDTIEAGPWSLTCRRADETAAWLKAASVELAAHHGG